MIQLVSYNFSIVENPISDGGKFSTAAVHYGNLQAVSGNLAEPSTAGMGGLATYTAPPVSGDTGSIWPADQYSEVTVSAITATGFFGPQVRANAVAETGYVGFIGDGYAQIYTFAGGTNTPLGTAATPTIVDGDVWRLSVVGTTLTLTQNGNVMTSVVDTTYSSGNPGFFQLGTSAVTDSQLSLFAAGANQAAAPTFSPSGGEPPGTVTITSSTPGVTIYYTTDGSTPTHSSSSISNGGTVNISSPSTLKAMASVSGYADSSVASAVFAIGQLVQSISSFTYPESAQLSLTFASAVTKGHLLVAFCTCLASTTIAQPTIDDGGINNWIPLANVQTASNGYIFSWYAVAKDTRILTIKFFGDLQGSQQNQAVRSNLDFPSAEIMEFSGTSMNPLDAVATNTSTSASASATVTAALANELIVGMADVNNSSITNYNGYTPTGPPTGSAGYSTGGPGAVSPTFTLNSSILWGMIAAAFRPIGTAYTISGTVAAPNAEILFESATTGVFYSTTSDGAGNYTSPGLENDTYVIWPSCVGFLFTPVNAVVTISGSNKTQNFTTTVINTLLVLSTTASDTFHRANENPLNPSNWETDGLPIPPADAGWQILNDEACMADATIYANFAGPFNGDGIVTWIGSVLADNQWSELQIDDLASRGGSYGGWAALDFLIRSNGPTVVTSILMLMTNNGNGTCNIVAINETSGGMGSSTLLILLNQPFSLGDRFALAVFGNTYYVLRNRVTIANFSSDAYTSGYASFVMSGLNVSDVQVSDFSAGEVTNVLPPTYTITGNVGVVGATVGYSGTSSGSVTSGAGGYYIISGLANGSYTITVSYPGHTFTPASIPVIISGANQTGVNFSLVSGSGSSAEQEFGTTLDTFASATIRSHATGVMGSNIGTRITR